MDFANELLPISLMQSFICVTNFWSRADRCISGNFSRESVVGKQLDEQAGVEDGAGAGGRGGDGVPALRLPLLAEGGPVRHGGDEEEDGGRGDCGEGQS